MALWNPPWKFSAYATAMVTKMHLFRDCYTFWFCICSEYIGSFVIWFAWVLTKSTMEQCSHPSGNHLLDSEAEHSRFGSACCSNFRPTKWLKPIARYLRLNRFDQRSASLVISDSDHFWSHQAHSSDAVPSDLAEFHVVALVWPLQQVAYVRPSFAGQSFRVNAHETLCFFCQFTIMHFDFSSTLNIFSCSCVNITHANETLTLISSVKKY